MKAKIILLSIMILFLLSCNLYANATPTKAIQTATPTLIVSNTVTLNNVTFAIPQGVAKDALSEIVPATDPNAAPWEIAPEHLEFTLTSYQLQDMFHQPKIFVYPAEAYAQAQPSVAENIQRIKNIAAGAPLSKNSTPSVPLFNAASLIASKLEVINFQSGSGVRFLTDYAQYRATINNHDLFYLFEGLTSDSKYYIIVILPINAPILAETDKPDAVIPAGGVPVPASGPTEAYYAEITDKLNALTGTDFKPALADLDALVKSIIVKP
jgi:hypothetical protein